MPDVNLVRVNRVMYSWTSLSFSFMGLPYKGVTGCTFKDTREIELVYGAQQDGTPLGMTAGVYKVENVSFTLLRDSAYSLLADLSALGLGSYGDAEFLFMMTHFEPALPVPSLPLQTAITGCRITGVEDKQEQGNGKLVTELSCNAMTLVRTMSGVPLQLWSQSRSLLGL